MTDIQNLKQVLTLKDGFAKKRHNEKMELQNTRFKQAVSLLEKRDKFAEKRHKERLGIMSAKYE